MKFDNVLMKNAYSWAEMSYCKRLKVGCVIARDSRPICVGYNGTVSGAENKCEERYTRCCGIPYKDALNMRTLPNVAGSFHTRAEYRCKNCGETFEVSPDSGDDELPYVLKTSPFVIHAEQNAIYFAAKNGLSLEGATMYVTHSPCPVCSMAIASSGIKRLVYSEDYRDDSGIKTLKKLGVQVEKLTVD